MILPLLFVGTCMLRLAAGSSPGESITLAPGWWAEWSEWQSCITKCENGTRKRKRTCPAGYCLPVDGDIEHGYCEMKQYCRYGGWSEWSDHYPNGACSKQCGGGRMPSYRNRTCIREEDLCPNSSYIETTTDCNTQPCFMHGGWGSWFEWEVTPCSTTCGFGEIVQRRIRTCTRPRPSGGGDNCEGDNWEVHTQGCKNSEPCPTQPPTTTLHLPENWNPTVYILTSTLIGVPVLITLICIITALCKVFVCKPTSSERTTITNKFTTPHTANRVDYYSAEDDWGGGRVKFNRNFDMPNDAEHKEPEQPKNSTYYNFY